MMRILYFMLLLAIAPVQQAATGSIEGTVIRTGTTDPIERVQVTLTQPGSSTAVRTVTDKEGKFAFSNLAAGGYTIRLQRDGYLVPGSTLSVLSLISFSVTSRADYDAFMTGYEAASVGGEPAAIVYLPERGNLTDLKYYLTPGGTISGRILDPLGRPAVGADVSALRLFYQEGRATVSLVKAVFSNDRGEYRMFWLEPGNYIIRAEKLLPSGPARAYYPGATRVAAAVKVQVSAGAESPKIDIALEKDETFKISGTITNIVAGMQNALVTAPPPPVAGQPVDRQALRAQLEMEASQASAQQFYLSPADPDEIYDGPSSGRNTLTSTEDRAAGKFEIGGVRPGSYVLIAVVTDRSSTPPRYFAGKTPVELGAQNLTDLNLLIAPGRDLRGRVVFSANVPPPVTPLRVQLRPKGLFPVLPFGPALSAMTEANGTFTILNVPDLEYSVSVSPLPKDAYVADLRQGSFSIFDVGTIVPGKRANDDFEVILDSPGASIAGKVTADNPELAAGAAIALVPDERRRENLLLYRRANASAAGVFSMTGLAPGRYRVFAFQNLPAGAEFNADLMDGYFDDGKEITLAPGDTSAVELRLIPK